MSYNALRTLARSNEWQMIYCRSKEMGQIGIFENKSDYTPLQIAFLQWLEIYYSLSCDLASKKPHITEEVIEDDIRCDAYLHWRRLIENKDEKELAKIESQTSPLNDGAVIFRRPPRKKK